MLLVVVLLIVAIAITVLKSREPMSNADVLTAMKQYGVDDTEPTSKKKKVAKAPILGPVAENPVEEDPDAMDSANKSLILSNYPNIYGPDKPLVPGVKPNSDDSETDYNIDLQKLFPGAGGPPKPFLTDFSKFQR